MTARELAESMVEVRQIEHGHTPRWDCVLVSDRLDVSVAPIPLVDGTAHQFWADSVRAQVVRVLEELITHAVREARAGRLEVP